MDVIRLSKACERLQALYRDSRRTHESLANDLRVRLKSSIARSTLRPIVCILCNTDPDDPSLHQYVWTECRRKLSESKLLKVLDAASKLPLDETSRYKTSIDLKDLPEGKQNLAFDSRYVAMRIHANSVASFVDMLSSDHDTVSVTQLLLGSGQLACDQQPTFRTRACRNALAGLMGLLETIRNHEKYPRHLDGELWEKCGDMTKRLHEEGTKTAHRYDPSTSTDPRSRYETELIDAYSEHNWTLCHAFMGQWDLSYRHLYAQLDWLDNAPDQVVFDEVARHICGDFWFIIWNEAENWPVNAKEVLRRLDCHGAAVENATKETRRYSDIRDEVTMRLSDINDC